MNCKSRLAAPTPPMYKVDTEAQDIVSYPIPVLIFDGDSEAREKSYVPNKNVLGEVNKLLD